MARRQHVTLMFAAAVIMLIGLSWLLSSSGSSLASLGSEESAGTDDLGPKDFAQLSESVLFGESIAPKLENATLKAELGRASWKLFHTMMARFPEKPSADDSLALKNYIHLFARLYPCGECAAHFRKLLQKYPPQVNSRNNAAGWACLVHNEVNRRLKKADFDCSKIGDFYDCGCGDEKKGGADGDSSLVKEGLTAGG